jgi:hypothetical protein
MKLSPALGSTGVLAERRLLDHSCARLALRLSRNRCLSETRDRLPVQGVIDLVHLDTRADLLEQHNGKLPAEVLAKRLEALEDRTRVLRLVEIAGETEDDEPYDRTACAGTHVANTAEIGDVVVTGRETKGPEEERVRFALADHVDED